MSTGDPHHFRAPSLGEIHQEIEQEQEAQVVCHPSDYIGKLETRFWLFLGSSQDLDLRQTETDWD